MEAVSTAAYRVSSRTLSIMLGHGALRRLTTCPLGHPTHSALLGMDTYSSSSVLCATDSRTVINVLFL